MQNICKDFFRKNFRKLVINCGINSRKTLPECKRHSFCGAYGKKRRRQKRFVPVLGKGEQYLINSGLPVAGRVLLRQPDGGGKHPQFERADGLRRVPQPRKVVVGGIAAGHGAGSTIGGNTVFFGADDGKHPLQFFFRDIRLCQQAQTCVQHFVGVIGFRFAGGGAGKADERTEKLVPHPLSRRHRGFEKFGHEFSFLDADGPEKAAEFLL